MKGLPKIDFGNISFIISSRHYLRSIQSYISQAPWGSQTNHWTWLVWEIDITPSRWIRVRHENTNVLSPLQIPRSAKQNTFII